jgi:hypothetical protein
LGDLLHTLTLLVTKALTKEGWSIKAGAGSLVESQGDDKISNGWKREVFFCTVITSSISAGQVLDMYLTQGQLHNLLGPVQKENARSWRSWHVRVSEPQTHGILVALRDCNLPSRTC